MTITQRSVDRRNLVGWGDCDGLQSFRRAKWVAGEHGGDTASTRGHSVPKRFMFDRLDGLQQWRQCWLCTWKIQYLVACDGT